MTERMGAPQYDDRNMGQFDDAPDDDEEEGEVGVGCCEGEDAADVNHGCSNYLRHVFSQRTAQDIASPMLGIVGVSQAAAHASSHSALFPPSRPALCARSRSYDGDRRSLSKKEWGTPPPSLLSTVNSPAFLVSTFGSGSLLTPPGPGGIWPIQPSLSEQQFLLSPSDRRILSSCTSQAQDLKVQDSSTRRNDGSSSKDISTIATKLDQEWSAQVRAKNKRRKTPNVVIPVPIESKGLVPSEVGHDCSLNRDVVSFPGTTKKKKRAQSKNENDRQDACEQDHEMDGAFTEDASRSLGDKDYEVGAVVTSISKNDVLCGRGKGPNNHSGNRRFRELVRQYRSEYLGTKAQKAKKRICNLIIDTISSQSPPGRFLARDGAGGTQSKTTQQQEENNAAGERWCVIDRQKARIKTSQALREGFTRVMMARGTIDVGPSSPSSSPPATFAGEPSSTSLLVDAESLLTPTSPKERTEIPLLSEATSTKTPHPPIHSPPMRAAETAAEPTAIGRPSTPTSVRQPFPVHPKTNTEPGELPRGTTTTSNPLFSMNTNERRLVWNVDEQRSSITSSLGSQSSIDPAFRKMSISSELFENCSQSEDMSSSSTNMEMRDATFPLRQVDWKKGNFRRRLLKRVNTFPAPSEDHAQEHSMTGLAFVTRSGCGHAVEIGGALQLLATVTEAQKERNT